MTKSPYQYFLEDLEMLSSSANTHALTAIPPSRKSIDGLRCNYRGLLKFAGSPSLIQALQTNNMDNISTALKEGANINEITQDGEFNALHLLARQEKPNLRILKQVLDADININAQDVHDFTPLHWFMAQDKPDIEALDLLLAKKPNVNQKNLLGETPLHVLLSYCKTQDPI